MEYGFPNVFFDFMSETGALYIFGDEESDQLLELEG